MTDSEKRLLERAEKLRREMILAEQWLLHNDAEKAKQVISKALREDG